MIPDQRKKKLAQLRTWLTAPRHAWGGGPGQRFPTMWSVSSCRVWLAEDRGVACQEGSIAHPPHLSTAGGVSFKSCRLVGRSHWRWRWVVWMHTLMAIWDIATGHEGSAGDSGNEPLRSLIFSAGGGSWIEAANERTNRSCWHWAPADRCWDE